MPYCEYASPIGVLTLVASDAGLQAVWWPDDKRLSVTGDVQPVSAGENLSHQHPVLQQAVHELDEYFAGTRTSFDVPLDPAGTEFQKTAWDVLRSIPYAQTITYAEQARRLGDPKKARAVGSANGRNPISIVVPCHRVVGSAGALTGFAGGLGTKQWLLDFERDQVGG